MTPVSISAYSWASPPAGIGQTFFGWGSSASAGRRVRAASVAGMSSWSQRAKRRWRPSTRNTRASGSGPSTLP
jgi:hypothetical protein